jgi:hypothetical protein
MKVACFSVAAMDFFPQQNKYYAGGNSLNQPYVSVKWDIKVHSLAH